MPNLHAAIVLTASAATLCVSASAMAAADFPAIVRDILESQTDGPLSQMGPAKRSAMTDCVVASLAPLPTGQKRYIVEGQTFEEQERRFGKVVYDNHAEWEHNIAKACADIALKDDAAFD